eukprot:4202781-Prymnesium_polylepis.1
MAGSDGHALVSGRCGGRCGGHCGGQRGDRRGGPCGVRRVVGAAVDGGQCSGWRLRLRHERRSVA